MTSVSRPLSGRLAALPGVLLLVAQLLATAHAYQHDVVSPVDRTCASCVIGGQLATACADTANDRATRPDIVSHEVHQQVPSATVIIPAAKQRGPPS